MDRAKGLSAVASLAGVALITAGLVFTLALLRWRFTAPSQPFGDEEIVAALAELKSVLERDEAVAQEPLLPLDLSRPDPIDVTTLRNAGNFWEPAFRDLGARMRKQ